MPLGPGSRLDAYELVRPLGAGGMGEVWLATETKLGRKVALKLLPAELTQDPARVARFEQEARAASALNHPNVCTILALGETPEGQHYIAMEYVEGETLRKRLSGAHLTIRESLDIAIQIVSALAAAHAAGIVHRDVKPENVMVRPDGLVKVVDFGLAKLTSLDATAEMASTQTAFRTEAGMVVGTIAYLSPEQATGGPVDGRSDVFSFGATLYEMVIGKACFRRRTAADTLTAVIAVEPRITAASAPGIPDDLVRVITRCLRKEPERRFQDMADLRVSLIEVKENLETTVAATTPMRQTTKQRRWLVPASIAAVAVAWLVWPSAASRSQRIVPLTALQGDESDPSFSPDGDQVAFSWDGEQLANTDIYVTLVGSTTVRRLTDDPGRDVVPSWSPDGRQIAFVRHPAGERQGRLYVMSALGGDARRVTEVPVRGPIAWAPDGQHLVVSVAESSEGGAIYLLGAAGDGARRLTTPAEHSIDLAGCYSPDGRSLAYVSCGNTQNCHVFSADVDRVSGALGVRRRLTVAPTWITGSLTWSRDGQSVIYASQPVVGVLYLWRARADATSKPERIELAGLGATAPAVARSQDRLVFSRSFFDVDVYAATGGRAAQPVIASSFPDFMAQFSPDGRRIVFATSRSGQSTEIWTARADGSAAAQLLTGPGRLQAAPHWSPDGSRILFSSQADDGRWHIWTAGNEGGAPQQVTWEPGEQNVAMWSHDGRWIYYSVDRGSQGIWRAASDGQGPKRLTSSSSGELAVKMPDGVNVLYQPSNADGPILMMPVKGGQPRRVVDCARRAAFSASTNGIYYVGCEEETNPHVHVAQPASGQVRVVARLEDYTQGYDPFGLAVAPNASAVLYNRSPRRGADLMLIEGFR